MTAFRRPHMPPLGGAAEWLNSEPLDPAGLRGRVVLVNFWTLTCMNWLRQEPHVRAWSRAYRDDGLVVIGVRAQFSFEHDIDGVRRATADETSTTRSPINDYAIWSAFDNHYWPALYFVNADGVIADDHFGEGRYEESERVIQRLLGLERRARLVEGRGVEAEADWAHLRAPETYLGHARGERFASPRRATFDERRAYALPERLRLNHWALVGEWTVGREKVVLDHAGGSIYTGSRRATRTWCCRPERTRRSPSACSWTAKLRARSAHGLDVNEHGNGVLRDGRLYQLVRERDEVRERTLEITFLEPGAEAYAFTFG